MSNEADEPQAGSRGLSLRETIDRYGTPTLRTVAALRALRSAATPGPWCWWTSNSMRRLSSKPSGKDGDVLHAFRATDGVPCVAVSDADAALIADAVNSLERLLAIAEAADALVTSWGVDDPPRDHPEWKRLVQALWADQ